MRIFQLRKGDLEMMRFFLSSIIILVILILDQASKHYILAYVMAPPKIIDVTSFFQLVLVWNKGISFGLFGSGDYTWIVAIFAILVTLFLGQWMFRARTTLLAAAIALVVGGAIGNLIDRLRFGAVIDFLYFHLGDYYWPAFNVADAAICIGVGLIVLDGLLLSKESLKK